MHTCNATHTIVVLFLASCIGTLKLGIGSTALGIENGSLPSEKFVVKKYSNQGGMGGLCCTIAGG